MRNIQISTDVFARIWSLRSEGEDSEDAVLRRVLWKASPAAGSNAFSGSPHPLGLAEERFGVVFPEGFKIERKYLGKHYHATVQNGQWVIEGVGGRFSTLNELSRTIGTKTENAWINWFFVNASGQRRPVSDLRDPDSIATRPKETRQRRTERTQMTALETKPRWCDDVRTALSELGGSAPLHRIYSRVEDIRKAAGRPTPESLEAVVRKELEVRSSDSDSFDVERGEDWFRMAEGKGGGVWALRDI